MPPKLSKIPKLSTTIEDLPCELMVKIFELLNYEFVDLINLLKLRLVCKNWSIIIKNEIKFDELNIFDLNFFHFGNHYSWFYLNKAFDYRYNLYDHRKMDEIQEPILTRIYLKSNLFRLLFSNLKYLCLNFKLDDKFNVMFLNEFKFLVQLQIWTLKLSKKFVLNLSNLTTLAIYRLETKTDNLLKINCPKLINLLFNGNCLNKIMSEDTKQIKYLEVSQKWINKAGYFQNLEILYSHINNVINLEYLPNLKQLNIFDYVQVMGDYRSECIRLLNKKIELNRSKLEITLQSIRFTTKEQFDRINFEEKEPFLQLNNYELLSVKLPCLKRFEFDSRLHKSIKIIINKLKNPQFNDIFISKLNNIQSIQLFDLEEKIQNDLLNLLSRFNNLRELEFTDTSLYDDFFNQLPDFCPHLNYLSILSNSIDNDYKLMLNKFNYLIYLSLYTDYIKPRTVANCFDVKKHLSYFKFCYRDKFHNVQRVNNYFYLNGKKIDTFKQLKTKLLSI